MINIAVVGLGYWGPNLARNFDKLADSNLYACCDLGNGNLDVAKDSYPKIKYSEDFNEIIDDPKVNAVVIATPAKTHYELVKKALLKDKHVYVEKPFTLNVAEAEELVELVKKKDKKLMVGHLLEYHPAVEKLKELIDNGELGNIYYLYSQRVNLGKIRQDENALWSFAPHDISVILYLLGTEPVNVSVRGNGYLQDKIEDVVFVSLYFPNRVIAQLHLSWLDPHKIRKLTIVGSEKMVVFDDMESEEKIRIYDKGVTKNNKYFVSYDEFLTLKFGDILIPHITMSEPLKRECQHFLNCIKENKTPRSDGKDGLRVVKVLDAAQKSLDRGGEPIKI